MATWQAPQLEPKGVHSSRSTIGLTKARPLPLSEVKLTAKQTPSSGKWEGDVLAFAVVEEAVRVVDGKFADAELAQLDASLGGLLSALVQEERFAGHAGEAISARLVGHSAKRLCLVGLGRKEELVTEGGAAWAAFGAAAAKCCRQGQAASLALGPVGELPLDGADQQQGALQALTSALLAGLYQDTRFKSKGQELKLQSISVVGLGEGSAADEGLQAACKLAQGVVVARQLVKAPANVLTPGALADAALAIVERHSSVLSATILEKAQCEELGMGAYLSVTAASDDPPKFLHLKYTPPGSAEVKKRVALVGKGITHDTGGYNIKVGCGIENMKDDMGGAAAVLGVAEVLGALQPPGVEVHFISAVCENMISGHGTHPGDVVTASNGKTIEVTNTDAEGRLTLADALVYACKLKVDTVVDIATLTGAIVTALGDDVAGFFTPSNKLADSLSWAARRGGEKLWRMPLERSYFAALKSPVADLRNSDMKRACGSIKAALFLKEFVEEGVEWAHIDIAGTAYNAGTGEATGSGVATLVEWIRNLSAS